MHKEFWQGKRVFLTGQTGFKGGWLAIWLQHLGAEVHGYALEPDTEPNLFSVARVREYLVSDIRGDIRDLDALARAMMSTDPNIVIHMAAQPLVRRSYAQPVETFNINVMGTVHLLQAARHCSNLGQVLVVTSDKCYENREEQRGYQEGEPLGGYDPYSSSKACTELVTQAYRQSFFNDDDCSTIGVATARAGNVIGGGDWSDDRLIPDMVRAWLKHESVQIRQPKAVRPWQHVLDALNGYLVLIEKLADSPNEYSGAWNFGPEVAQVKDVSWVVERFASAWDGGKWHYEEDPSNLHEALMLALDCTKSRTRLGWKPKLEFDESINWTARWYRAFADGADMAQETLDQIRAFQTGCENDDA